MSLTIGRVARTLLKFYEKYGWTQGDYALDSRGQSVDYFNPQAKYFCLEGALRKLTQDPVLVKKHGKFRCLVAHAKAYTILGRPFSNGHLNFNDDNTQEVVFKKLRELARLP